MQTLSHDPCAWSLLSLCLHHAHTAHVPMGSACQEQPSRLQTEGLRSANLWARFALGLWAMAGTRTAERGIWLSGYGRWKMSLPPQWGPLFPLPCCSLLSSLQPNSQSQLPLWRAVGPQPLAATHLHHGEAVLRERLFSVQFSASLWLGPKVNLSEKSYLAFSCCS